jgi:surface antigen-like variable number repeat protein
MMNHILKWLFVPLFLLSVQLFSQDVEYIIHDINIIGNQKTKADIILRELIFSIGDTLRMTELSSKFEESKNNLLNTSLFNYVTLQSAENGSSIEIFVIVEERWYLWPYPIFEYADRNINTWLKEKEYDRINYGLHVIKYNFRGRREILNFKVRLGFREQYMILYENPYLDKNKKFGLFLGFAKFRQKEIPFKTEFNEVKYFTSNAYLNSEISTDIALTYRNKWYISHTFNVGYSYSNVADTIISLNNQYHFNNEATSEYLKFKYLFEYDKRNSKIYPLKGNKLFASFSQYGLGIINSVESSISIINFGFQYNTLVIPKLYFSSFNVYKSSLNEELPYFSRNGIGFDDNIRGYEFYVIHGKSYFVMNNDLKLNVLPKKVFVLNYIPFSKFNKVHLSIYLNSFFDLGYVATENENATDYLANELLYSGGLGLDFITYYDKILRVNFAVNNYNEKNIFIHFKIPF